MVIERALEKLKQANQKAPAVSPRGTSSRGPDAIQERPSARQPSNRAGNGQAPHGTEAKPRPTFPVISCDPSEAEAHRALLPDFSRADDHRATAAYRMLRTRLLHRMRTSKWTTIAITSPGAGEGKSVTSLNLALNVARERSMDVFLIDLDLRKPTICAQLGVAPRREIIDYFAGTFSPAETFFSIGVENLAIAGGLECTDDASELLATERFDEMIRYCESISTNPCIIIDLPPLLVTDEALLIAPRVDAVLMVVAEGRTRRDSLVRAKQMLADFTLVGVVLNRSLESFGIDSYYGDSYRYRDPKS